MISDPEECAVPEEERRTPRQEKRAQTRAALLDAAERLWAKHGIRGASLDEIAAQAGMTKGAVYSNFTGKTDLILALLDRYTHLELGRRTSSTLRDTGRAPADRCADAGRHYARRLSAEETRMKALLLMELWLFGMRDFSAGWRIADWYQNHREGLAAGLTDQRRRRPVAGGPRLAGHGDRVRPGAPAPARPRPCARRAVRPGHEPRPRAGAPVGRVPGLS